jgi:hypothetical protein
VNRQHYVFLEDGDVIQDGDEWLDECNWNKCTRLVGNTHDITNGTIRRPVATQDAPSDKMKARPQ